MAATKYLRHLILDVINDIAIPVETGTQGRVLIRQMRGAAMAQHINRVSQEEYSYLTEGLYNDYVKDGYAFSMGPLRGLAFVSLQHLSDDVVGRYRIQQLGVRAILMLDELFPAINRCDRSAFWNHFAKYQDKVDNLNNRESEELKSGETEKLNNGKSEKLKDGEIEKEKNRETENEKNGKVERERMKGTYEGNVPREAAKGSSLGNAQSVSVAVGVSDSVVADIFEEEMKSLFGEHYLPPQSVQ